MKPINKRLERLEKRSFNSAGEKMDTISPIALAAKEFEFKAWQQRRVEANLPAGRDVYDAEQAADEAAFQAYKASVPVDAWPKLPTAQLVEVTIRWQWMQARKRADLVRRSQPPSGASLTSGSRIDVIPMAEVDPKRQSAPKGDRPVWT